MAHTRSRERRRRQANRAAVRLERAYLRDLKKHRKATAKLLSGYRDGASIRIVLYDRFPVLKALITTWMKRVLFLFGPMVIDHINVRSGGGAPEQKDSFDIFREQVLLWLDDYAFNQAVNMTEAMAEVATDVLKSAFEQGLGEDETARILQEAIGGDFSSAARIARTEVHTAANFASDTAARATGLDLVKEWATTADSRARQSHVDADGQRREMDEPFEVGGSSLDFPGDPKGSAEEVINCRCTVLYHPRINGTIFD